LAFIPLDLLSRSFTLSQTKSPRTYYSAEGQGESSGTSGAAGEWSRYDSSFGCTTREVTTFCPSF
jgi:hypothetical protein